MRARLLDAWLLDPAASCLAAVALSACTWIDDEALDTRLAQDRDGRDAAEAGCRAPVTEALPDGTVAVMAIEDSSLVESTAQDIGTTSPIGCVDVVTGVLVFGPDQGWSVNDSDAYSFAVPAAARLSLTAGWADSAADLDFGIWSLNGAGTASVDLFSTNGESNCIGSTDPEQCTSAIELSPSEGDERPYMLVALGYLGDADATYQLELEWLAP